MSLPASVDMSAYREPGTDNTDIDPRDGVATRMVNATTEGFRTGAAGRTDPEAVAGREQFNRGNPINTWVVSPAINLAGGVMGAAGGAIGQGAYELGNLYSPELGRDAYMGAQVIGALSPLKAKIPSAAEMTAAPRINPNMKGFEQQAATPQFVSERMAPNVSELDPRNAIQTLIQHDITENPPPAPDRGAPNQGAIGLQPPVLEQPSGGPRSAGAAGTPFADATLTPEQSALYGSVDDKQWLYKSKTPGEVDNTEYVKGIHPTMAQREQTANAARDMKTQRNLSTEAAQAERVLLDDHNTLRKNEFQNVAGSDVTQGIAIDAAEKNIDDALGKAFNAGGEVNNQPIVAAIQAERNAPSGKLPPVKAVMKVIEDAMRKPDGSGLETDPTQVYGVRRVINYLQSKNAIAENPAYGSPDVQAALIRVKGAIDGAVEPVAPGFTKAIGDYAKARQAFDVNEALQKWEPKLYDGLGRMQFLPMHRLMNEIIQSRDPRAPLNPWQSLTETQMKQLKSLHDDLMRVASAEDLAKARGSDTAPNILDAIKEAASGLPGTLAAGVVGHVVGGPIGAAAGAGAKAGIQGVFTRRAERAATEKMNRLLRPDPAQYPTRPNPLFGPDALP
jgi:hypothetical protein